MKLEELKKLSEAKCNCDIDWGHKPDCPVNIRNNHYRKLDHFEALLDVASAARFYIIADGFLCATDMGEALKKLEEIK